MDTRTAIRRHETEANRLHELVRETHRVRTRSPRHHDRWVGAARAVRDHIARLKAELTSLKAQDPLAEGPLRAFFFAYATVDPY